MLKRNHFHGVLILLLFLSLSSCREEGQDDWNTYRGRGKLFTIQYPADWKSALEGHTFNITPSNHTGLVAVTGYVDPGKGFNEQAFKDMVMLDFEQCHVEQPFQPVKGSNWVGEDAVYVRIINRRKFIYLFRIAHRGQVGVFIAVSEIERHLDSIRPDYQQIMNSLVILDAPTTVENGSPETIQNAKKQPWQETLVNWIRATEPKDNQAQKSYFSY